MSAGTLAEAYHRFHHTGPEWGEHELSNHGPMAVEVLVRRGRGAEVHRWIDRYARRLDDLPSAGDPIGDDNWTDALGDGRRVADWASYFARLLAERPWREVLGTWWPRLLPGIAAGTAHGVIRVGHVVRTLLAGPENSVAVTELAHGLAFWAARSTALPPADEPVGRLEPGSALDLVPRIPEQQGGVAARLGQVARLDGWPRSVGALRPATDPEDARARLTDLVTAATLRYLRHGHGHPVLLVHTATAPNAVLQALPALPTRLWAPSLSAVWTATAAVFAGYAPTEPAPDSALPTVPAWPDALAEVLDRAVSHGDEHVIKFADTAADVYARTGHPDALAAALHAADLIKMPD
ncbi:questin oxidase family protein [Micromonospora sp. WMMD1102]|uniref:questin oxidase family protein n=1 Tax=Micromonospora sp. WMMD1102 TaxID=3016105 RepID=UPI0024156E28|nr:questin oxidase family protein [Micromonospora sp. WMMD1102]MDG4791190.1 questin oxidase family protein [Micromonospora sp. WMMD1102]